MNNIHLRVFDLNGTKRIVGVPDNILPIDCSKEKGGVMEESRGLRWINLFGLFACIACAMICATPVIAQEGSDGAECVRHVAAVNNTGETAGSVLELVGRCDTPDYAVGVYVVGSYAYVADATSGLRVIDISNPAAPFQVGFCDAPGNAQAVYVSENYAYVANGYGAQGFWVIDISNPAAPFQVASIDTPGYACGVYVSENYAYVADLQGGLRIINVSSPLGLTEVAFVPTADDVYGVYVRGDYAYVADYGGGLRIIDVSNPEMPSSRGFVDLSYAYAVYVSGDYAYVADGDLWVINVSNPWAPFKVGFYDVPGNLAQAVYVSGDYAYMATNGNLTVVNVSDPSAPFEEAFYDTPGWNEAIDVFVSGSYVYVAEGDHGGMGIYSFRTGLPTPDIQVNGQDTPVTLSPGTSCAVTVGLEPGKYTGFIADWWIAVHTPFAPPTDWYTYVHPDNWMPGINRCAQTPLFEFSGFEVLDMALPSGHYTFYFAVDAPDGMVTADMVDSVEVTVE